MVFNYYKIVNVSDADEILSALLNMETLQLYVVEGRKPSSKMAVIPLLPDLYLCVNTT